jgi:hypothetical protein
VSDAGGRATAGAWPLSPRAARVFYNVADAWSPPEAGVDAGDAVAALASLDARGHVELERALRWLEWSPRLLLRSRRGLSWMERDARRAWLDHLERRGLPPLRRAATRAHAAVDVLRGGQSREGP